jgi:hypothetical protein
MAMRRAKYLWLKAKLEQLMGDAAFFTDHLLATRDFLPSEKTCKKLLHLGCIRRDTVGHPGKRLRCIEHQICTTYMSFQSWKWVAAYQECFLHTTLLVYSLKVAVMVIVPSLRAWKETYLRFTPKCNPKTTLAIQGSTWGWRKQHDL